RKVSFHKGCIVAEIALSLSEIR
ncbi:DUF645 family protein, partial [Vibrio cholerae]|nr:DUF645 family protein [Vibrio cholerae]